MEKFSICNQLVQRNQKQITYNFVSFDIVDYHPSISDELLDNAIAWAKTMLNIIDEHVATIRRYYGEF